MQATAMALYGMSFAIALVISLCLTPAVRALARRTGVVDAPDGRRKLHRNPVPMLGGIAVFISFYVSLGLTVVELDSPSAQTAFQLASATFAPSLLILGLGIVDDKWPVSPWVKMTVQAAAALVVYFQLGIRIDTIAPFDDLGASSAFLSLPATIFWIVLITNAFNVVDGMDGLATGVAFIALACMFIVSIQMHQPVIALAAAPLAGAVLGFLRYNFHPASIFLGDSGSLFLGFQLAVLSIVGSQKSSTAVAVTAPIFVLALPLVETATSAVRRFVSGRSIMQADAGHIHHQLMRLGCTPRRAAGILYLGSGAFGLASLFVIQSGSAHVGLIAVSFFAVTVMAIQQLGYTEFAEINGALKRFVLQRKIIENGIICRTLAGDLSKAASIGDAWSILKSAARRLGFSYVELTLHPPGEADEPVRRFAERLMPAPGSAQPPETTFAVALAGRGHAPGRVVFSRSTSAPPLHSELPLLINAVANCLPGVIERHFRNAVATPPSRHESPTVIVRANVEPADGSPEQRRADKPACRSCGSARLFRSPSRSILDRARKRLTRRRLYECGACGWRGWRMQISNATTPPVPPTAFTPPDLQALDVALRSVGPVQPQGR